MRNQVDEEAGNPDAGQGTRGLLRFCEGRRRGSHASPILFTAIAAVLARPPMVVAATATSDTGENSVCGPNAARFTEGDLQHAWTDSPYALAFGRPSVDPSRTLCGRSSTRTNADFRSEGVLTPTHHRTYEVGHFQVKVGGTQNFTGATVEAGVFLDGPSDTRALATIFLVSDARWIPGGWVALGPGHWQVLRHRFDERNDDGEDGSGTVTRVDKLVIAVVNSGGPWKGRVNVGAIRWYASPAAAPASVAEISPVPAPPPMVVGVPPPSHGEAPVPAPTPAVTAAIAPAIGDGGSAAAVTPPPSSPQTSITDAAQPAPVIQREALLSLRAGVQLPGEVTPKNLLIGKTGPGPLVLAELSRRIDTFTLGAFALYSRSDYKRYLYDDVKGDGAFTLVSLGSTGKARFTVSPALVLRLGGTIGPNVVWFSVNQGGTDYHGHGWGLNFGATAEASLRMSDAWRLSVQLAFTSQIAGTLSIDGDQDHHDLLFAPLFFFSVGPEWNL